MKKFQIMNGRSAREEKGRPTDSWEFIAHLQTRTRIRHNSLQFAENSNRIELSYSVFYQYFSILFAIAIEIRIEVL